MVVGPEAELTAGAAEAPRSVDTDGGDCANRRKFGAMRR
jgi:hypothetical protein